MTSTATNSSTQVNNQRTAQGIDQLLDQIMSIILRTGVLVAAFLVLTGGVVSLLHHNATVTNDRNFHGEAQQLRTIPGIIHEALAFHGPGLIQLGLLVLIATPVARVLFSVFGFLYEKDWTYVAITVIVLAILSYSLFGSH
jgi:uncharacterized membrane protein